MSALGPTPTQGAVKILEEKPRKENGVKYYVKFSFTITYILLLTTATITLIEALRTPDPKVRHILNLETCISIVAGYFYSVFTQQIHENDEKHTQINWANITQTRYIDWAITTPMMLLALALVLSQNSKTTIYASTIGIIIALNYLMLYIGYLGENGTLPRLYAMLGGFVPFIGMFSIIYISYVKPLYRLSNGVLFFIYLLVWSLYGIVFMFPEEYKNIFTNILDFIAKCFIGLGLWAYYTHIIHI
jgi:bacteriorhodopsin